MALDVAAFGRGPAVRERHRYVESAILDGRFVSDLHVTLHPYVAALGFGDTLEGQSRAGRRLAIQASPSSVRGVRQ
jgi:hypothetical protein